MANQPDTPTSTASKARPGPYLLSERRLAGIFVHLLGVPTWFVLPGVVYLVSEHEFTRANARNAVNWQVFYALLTVAVFVAFGLFALADSALPGGIPSEFGVGLFYALGAGFYALVLVFVLNLLFSLVATTKAIFGGAWAYPVAPDVVGWLGSTNEGGTRWWVPVGAYALVAPVLFGSLVWLALGNDVAFWLTFALLVASVLGSPIVAAALYRDAGAVCEAETVWRPNRALYVGAPLAAGALTYPVRASLVTSENPSGDAVYAFMAVLWLAAVVYLYRRRRHVGPS